MARNVAYYIDAEEEERKRRQVEEAFGPPPPPPNLGVMSKGQMAAADVEAAEARALSAKGPTDTTDWDKVPEAVDSDEDLASALDAIAEDPESYSPLSPEEMARAVAWKKAHGQPVPAGIEQQAPVAGQKPGESALDVFLEPGVVEKFGAGALGQRLPLEEAQKRAIRQGTDLSIFDTTSRAANPYEEEAQARAAEQKQSAPAAVDKQAASVADAQKGVPGQAPARTDEELAQPGARTGAVAEAMMAGGSATDRNYGNTAGRMMGTPQRGERTDLLGFDDEEGFSRQRQIERARQAYGQEDAPSHRWEEEFLRGRERLTDAQIRRRSAVMGVFGDPHQGEHWAEGQRRANAGYDEGLEKARARDAGEQRVSPAMAEALAATGQFSPEAAARVRRNDDLVRNFGQFASQGGRAEGQGVGLSKEKLRIMASLAKSDNADDRMKLQAMLQSATQLDVAEMRGQGMNRLPTEVELGGMAAFLGQTFGGGPKNGMRILHGDLGDVPPDRAEQAQNMAAQLLAGNVSKGGLGSVYGDSLRAQGTQPIKDKFAIDKAIEQERQKPGYRVKFKNDWDSAAIPFREAWGAWNDLKPDAQARFAEWAAGGFTGDVLKFLSTPEEQEKFAAVRGVINALVKDRSGSAVTGSEWERIASEIGLEADNWGPFNSPGTVTKFLKRTGTTLEQHRANFEDEFGNWESIHGR
jgi:hypothetical protein